MPNSLNGWTVLIPGSPKLATGTVPGTKRRLTCHKTVLPLFLALAYDYDDWLAPIDVGITDEGAYSYRQARNASGWSNHASGSAVDINWSAEGSQNSKKGKNFFAVPQHAAAIEQIKKVYQVVWGGDWDNYLDYMHFEIPRGTTVAQVAARVKFLGIDAKGVRHNAWNGKPLGEPRG